MQQDYYQQGLELAKAGDRQAALLAFDQALQVNPQLVDGYLKRAALRAELGDRDGALADYSQALRLQPSPEGHLGRALLYLAVGELQGAVMDAEQALLLSSNLPAAHHLLGTAYRRQGKVPAAIAAYKQAAKLYVAEKDKLNAQRCLDAIMQLQSPSPDPAASAGSGSVAPVQPLVNPEQFFQQILHKVQQGNHRDALTDLDWLILSDPSNAEAYCQRGIVYSKIGRRKEAIRDLTEASRLAPQDPKVLLYRAMVRLELEDARGAIAELMQIINHHSASVNADVYFLRGNAYSQIQDYRRAIEDYARALHLAPTNPEIYYQCGKAREAFGDRAGALSNLQQAANLWLTQGNAVKYDQALDTINTLQAAAPVPPISSGISSGGNLSVDDFATQPLDLASLDQRDELWSRLLQLVGGNQSMAERLLHLAAEKYPGKSDTWYLERVIADLEGDR